MKKDREETERVCSVLLDGCLLVPINGPPAQCHAVRNGGCEAPVVGIALVLEVLVEVVV